MPSAKRPLQVLVGVLAGLAISEGVFHFRDGGAFPHLNVYESDPDLGVRLRPRAEERVSFGGNPVSSVRINAQGYRGADWPAPGDDEVLVVGDSMAFGLGAPEDQTFASRVEKELGARVLDAGVPTWGPPEYERALAGILAERRPKTVIYTLNMLNDPFEARRPNTERHRVWDGWAVRRETAPASWTSFPGRELLFRRSHAVFALRQWLYFKGGGSAVARGVASEGDLGDLVDLSSAMEAAKKAAHDETERRAALHEAEARYATLSAVNADLHVKLLAYKTLKLSSEQTGVYLASNAIPGDIVVPQLGEEASPLGASTKYVTEAVALRDRLEKELRARAEADKASADSKEIFRSLDERDRLEKRLREVHAAPLEIVRASLPIVEVVLRAKALAEQKGARFVLLLLPLDVQVSAGEWKKYGKDPGDASAARVLEDDLAAAVRDAGGTVVDPTAELTAAEPGAYLDHDPHPSPKGHEAIAKAIVRALREPAKAAPPKGPLLALPEGRSRIPRPHEWALVSDYLVHGSSAAGCVTKRIREWVYVRCQAKKGGPTPVAARVLAGGHGDALALANNGVVTLVAPVVRGDSFEARFSFQEKPGDAATKARRLSIHWPADVIEPEASLEVEKEAGDPPVSEDLTRLCQCWQETTGDKTCEGMVAAPGKDCLATYGGSCKELIECATGWPVRMPRCPEGQVNAGAELWCFTPCGEGGSCKEGTCTETQGAKLCVTASSTGGGKVAPAPPPPPAPTGAPFAAADFAALARPAVDAALKAADVCKLVAIEPGGWFDYVLYDECAWKGGEVAAYQEKAAPIAAYAASHEMPSPARTFADHARLFGEWLALAERAQNGRGTARLFQDLAIAWNLLAPDAKVDPDPPRIYKQYTEDFGERGVDYIWKSHNLYEAHRRKPRPFAWKNGAQGPYLTD